MEPKEKSIDFLDISPYVRYIHHLEDATSNNYYLPWRYIYDYEFIYVVDGTMTVLTENEKYELCAGDIHVMPPMVWHKRQIEEDETCNYYSIHFDFVYMGSENDFSPKEAYIDYCNNKRLKTAPLDKKLAGRPLFILGSIDLPKKMHTNNSVEYIATLNALNVTFKKKEFAYEIDIKCDMLILLKLMLNDIKAKLMTKFDSNSNDHLSAITQYVLDNFAEPICFEAICRIYGYSYSNFRKLFKQKTGKSPSSFLTDIRLDKATELLYTKKYTVSDVAEMVGYQDSCYFSRLYKQKKGCPPSGIISSKAVK